MKARIAEIFKSIQGEGLYLGERQLFVRFFGCNLSCKFCDTKPDSFIEYEPHELFEEIMLYRGDFHSVSFTGGEPLLYKDFLKDLLQLTCAAGFLNYLETNGTLPTELQEVIDYVDIVAMDLKLPSSTGMQDFWENHREFLKIASQKEFFLKAVICDSTSEEDLAQALKLIRQTNTAAVLVLQPDSSVDYRKLLPKLEDFRLMGFRDNVTTCVIPQMHKVVGIK